MFEAKLIVNIIGIILLLIGIVNISYAYYNFYLTLRYKDRVIPYLPTPKKITDLVCEIAGKKSFSNVIDIGSGNGDIIMALSQNFKNSHATFTGIEINPFHLLVSRFRVLFASNKASIHLNYGDALLHNYSNNDLITVFGLPHIIKTFLTPKLENELQKGARIISIAFPLVSMHFTEEIYDTGLPGWKDKVYVYTKK